MDGILNINKPAGITSYGVIDGLKKRLKYRKIGHAGTLDPNAQGVLLVLVDEATKISRFLMQMEKEYEGRMVLGAETDTQDKDGKVISRSESSDKPSREEIETAFARFTGRQRQVPPMVSAKSYRGERLYKLFRRGVTVPRSPAEVEVKSLALLSYGYPEVKFNVVCSGGTYVRTLCHDIGFFLGCGAYMSSLVRTRIGNFGTDESVPFTACVPGEKDIRPLNETLLSYPHFLVTERMAEGIKQGKQIVKSEILNMDSMLGKKYCGMFPVFDEKENLIALAETKSVSQESIRLLRVLQ